MMSFAEFQRRAVGVPFVQYGRDFDGWDCWGLCVAAYRECLGVEIPDFADYSLKDFRNLSQLFDRRDLEDADIWQRCEAHPLALALCYRRGLAIHAAVVVDARFVLHTESGINTCLERLSNFRVEGFYERSNCGATSI